MSLDEMVSTVQLRLGWLPRLRVLFGSGIEVRIAHRGPVDKVVLFLGHDELGQIVAEDVGHD